MGLNFFLVALATAVFLVGPILGILAFVRVRRIETGALRNLATLGRRVETLDQELSRFREKRPAPPTTAPPPPTAPTPKVPETPAPTEDQRHQEPFPVSQAAAPERPGPDLESLIGGRWLNRVGLLLVFFAAFFALKWEFDNNALGPTGRVALWTLIGAALLAYSQWLEGHGHRYLSEGLTGLGGALLYLTLYFGWDYYALFPQAVAFAAMVAVTTALVAIAIGRDSQRTALLGLIGGFLTPLLTSTGQDAQVVLFGYLFILDAGLLIVARARAWRGLEPLAFGCTTAFFWGWYGRFYDVSEPLVRTTAFATLFFAVFTALPVIRSRVSSRVFPEQVAQLLLNAGNYLLALYLMLWPSQRWALTAAALALAAFHLGVTRAIPRLPGAQPIMRMLFAGLALTFVTLATLIRLEGAWITVAWAVQAAVLVWSGFAVRWWFLRAAGLTLYLCATLRLAMLMPSADAFLLNARFATFAVLIACLGTALYLWRREPEQVGDGERSYFGLLGIGVNVLAVWALSLEVHQYFQPQLSGDPSAYRTAQLGRELALSLLWTLYASGLVVAGVSSGFAALRWQGLALFGLVVGKVFLLDLSFLSGGHRIASSIVLGIVLLAISFVYQRRLGTRQDGDAR